MAAGKAFSDHRNLERAPGLKAALLRVPHDPQGHIAAGDIETRIAAWKQSGLARTLVWCLITKNGKPLAGAVVTFVPEEFLGPEVKPGRGVTDAKGCAAISIEGANPPGMSCGFYRVEVTKPGENIPPLQHGHDPRQGGGGRQPAPCERQHIQIGILMKTTVILRAVSLGFLLAAAALALDVAAKTPAAYRGQWVEGAGDPATLEAIDAAFDKHAALGPHGLPAVALQTRLGRLRRGTALAVLVDPKFVRAVVQPAAVPRRTVRHLAGTFAGHVVPADG